jgi:hypothetical protein
VATLAVMTKAQLLALNATRRVTMHVIVPTKLQPAVLKEVEVAISQMMTPLPNPCYRLVEIL